MLEFFSRYRETIATELERYLSGRSRELAAVNPWGEDVCRRILEFSLRGKMIRGGLIALGYGLFRDDPGQAVAQAAAAMELLQSSFLVHDDIMDRDLTRRGLPTVFHQYSQVAADRGIVDARRFGEAMGICAGDAAFFFAFDLLSRIAAPHEIHQRLLQVCNTAVIETSIAQMQDVAFGASAGPTVAEDDVLRIYHYKTGRYTFTLPLSLGALLAGQGDDVLEPLARAGEHLGIIFQIKDDELGLFGDEQDIGKPVGSDVEEGKKTIFYVYLMEAANEEQKRELGRVFGHRGIGAEGLELVRRMVERLGVRSRVAALLDTRARQARRAIAAVPYARAEHRGLLEELLAYNLERSR